MTAAQRDRCIALLVLLIYSFNYIVIITLDLANEIIRNDDDRTLEWLCCCDKSIIDLKSDESNNLLHYAVIYDSIACVKVLLRLAPYLIDAASEVNNTPLMTAAKHGKVDVVKLLLQQKPKYDIKNIDGETALDRARIYGFADVEKLLRDYITRTWVTCF